MEQPQISSHMTYGDGYFIKKQPHEITFPVEKHPKLFGYANAFAIVAWALYESHLIFLVLLRLETSLLGILLVSLLVLCDFGLCLPEISLAMFPFLVSPPPSVKLQHPSRLEILGTNVPTVDIFVTCCGEDLEILEDTIMAAALQDYPADKLHVYVLDDAADPALETLVASICGKNEFNGLPRVIYLAREKTCPSYFKAGNLRFGLERSHELSNAPFVASLDADMLVRVDWLRTLLPHLLLNKSIALVCPPQQFYNVPSGDDRFGNRASIESMRSIYRVLLQQRSEAYCSGTGFVVRREAIESIGGWPLVDANEDYLCSIQLLSAGWQCCYIRDPVQTGLAPVTFEAFVKQKMRWSSGAMLISKELAKLTEITRQERPAEAGSYSVMSVASITLALFEPHTDIIVFGAALVLPFAVLLAATVDIGLSPQDIWRFKILFAANYIAYNVSFLVSFAHIGISDTEMIKLAKIWVSPYTAFAYVRLMWQDSGRYMFQSTGPILVKELKEIGRRQFSIYRLFAPPFLIYGLYACVAGGGFLFHLRKSFCYERAHIIAAGSLLKLFDCARAAMVPVSYAVRPPIISSRRDLLHRDQQGMLWPRQEQRTPTSSFSIVKALELAFVCLVWYL